MKATTKAELSMQYMPLYVIAYLTDAAYVTLSIEADSSFVRLSATQWREGALPADPARLIRLTKCNERQWPAVWAELEPLFPTNGTARANPEIALLRAERIAYLESRKSNGGGAGTGAKRGRKPKHVQQDMQQHEQQHGESTDNAHGPSHGEAPDEHRESTGNAHALPVLPQYRSGISLTPPSDDGGASPTPRDRDRSATRNLGVVASEFAASLDDVVAGIQHDEGRDAVRRFLEQQRIPSHNWRSWVARFVGWTKGMATTGMKPVSWEGIAIGLSELLDVNPAGQVITPKVALIFAEDAAKRVATVGVERAARDRGERSEHDSAVLFARAGDADAIRYCKEHNIDYREVA